MYWPRNLYNHRVEVVRLATRSYCNRMVITAAGSTKTADKSYKRFFPTYYNIIGSHTECFTFIKTFENTQISSGRVREPLPAK